MPYAPTVNDTSGQILAGYQTKSAEIKAAGNEALTKGIVDGSLSAISGIAGAYQQTKMQDAGGKAFKDFMNMAGPSMGIKEEDLKAFKSMTDYDAYQLSQSFMPVAPSMISANSYANNFAPRAQFAYQQAANQMALRQPAANQVPMTAPTAAPAAASPAAQPAPTFGAGINTRPAI